MPIHPVILCGGSGTRLWPLSRKSYPKQFAPLFGGESLFQASLRRLRGDGFDAPLVLTHADFRFLALEQMQALGLSDGRLLVEPEGRNTGPAVLVAALVLAERPDDLMLVAPSDHLIGNPAAFHRAATAGAAAARAGRLVTFGVLPDRAETGYGYLELAAHSDGAPVAQDLLRFVEKPDAGRAAAMIASGRHLWNSGIFLFRVGDILDAFESHAPDLIGPCRAALDEGGEDLGFFRLGAQGYGGAREVSIDYAVMEHAENLSVVPLEGGWTDLGSWDAVWRTSTQDGGGVATSGAVTAIGCERSLLRSDDETLHLVGLGLKNVV
ncbi:MAG: mannose-1-phosphate guanylyltransferase, partial [Paracoccaceae bacterium]